MLAAVSVALLGLLHRAAAQSTSTGGSDYNGYGPDFEPDPLTSGILAFFCIFTFFFILLTGWCFVALVLARGHRAPYAFLFPALVLTVLENGNNVALEVFLNMPFWYYLPTQLEPALEAIGWFFTNWAILLLFLSIIAVLWNRQTALRIATAGKAGSCNHALTVIYAVLALILFVLGTTAPAVYVNTIRKYLIVMNQITSEFDANTALEEAQLEQWFNQQQNLTYAIGYAFSSFVVFTGIVVVVSTLLLWRAGRAAGIKDKIINFMLYAVTPLYAAYNLFTFIFTIVFSNRGLPPTSSQTTFESAVLANNILLLLSYFAVAFSLVFMTINRTNWNIGGGNVQPTQQHLSQPTQPFYGSHQQMQVYNTPPIQQSAYYPQPLSYVPGTQPQVHTLQTGVLEDPSGPASSA